MANVKTIHGDFFQVSQLFDEDQFDLIYIDPPFFTNRKHKLQTRDGIAEYKFDDVWQSTDEYNEFILATLKICKRLLSRTGSIFVHCDRNASHLIRAVLDFEFDTSNFQAEIVWFYKRWSNSRLGLLPQHQVIFHYTKSSDYKFNRILEQYSPTTNVDQILQKRKRDERNKSVYATDDHGNEIIEGEKRGVPLGDVWEIPYLNPKAKERVGYPTQKPVLLLERIIEIATDKEDWVLDPFCGSGTTLVAALLNDRNAIGVDILPEAIDLANSRIHNPFRSESKFLERGKSAYMNAFAGIDGHLGGLEFVKIQRNKGIDAILKDDIKGRKVFIRIQRNCETIHETVAAIKKAAKKKGDPIIIVVKTIEGEQEEMLSQQYEDVYIIDSTEYGIERTIKNMRGGSTEL